MRVRLTMADCRVSLVGLDLPGVERLVRVLAGLCLGRAPSVKAVGVVQRVAVAVMTAAGVVPVVGLVNRVG